MKKQLLVLCVAAGSLSVACSQTSPTSPGPAASASAEQSNGGGTLKVDAPTLLSPAHNSQVVGNPTLSYSAVNGKFASFAVTYEVDVRNAAGQRVSTTTPTGATSVALAGLAFDALYTWKVRVYLSEQRYGPWSAERSFRTPPGQYLNADPEILDPLKTGTSVGQIVGHHTFVPGVGLRLENNESYVAYGLANNLLDGEFSFMATNVDEGNPGDKSKVMSMGEGCHDDVTDNDYRMTLEVRGAQYGGTPGTTSFRIITGDAREEAHQIRDSVRATPSWTRTDTYFFKMWWRTGSGQQAGYEIRRGSPTGPLHDWFTVTTSGRPYRPVPLCAYLGAPGSRGGPGNQTHAGMTVWDVWFSAKPRPAFLGGSASDPSLLSLVAKPGQR